MALGRCPLATIILRSARLAPELSPVHPQPLLHRLQNEPPKVLLQDWYKTDQTRRLVRSTVAEVLDRELPQESYDRVLFQAKCDNVFHLVLDHAAQGRKWAA